MTKLAVTLTLALLGGAALAQSTGTPAPAPAPVQTPAPVQAPAQTTTQTPAEVAPVQAAPAQTAPAQGAPTGATPAAATAPAAAQSPDTVVARVGTQNVTLGEFDRAFRRVVAQIANAQGIPVTDDLVKEFAANRADYLKQYVRDVALYQLARPSSKLDTAAIDEQLAQARKGFQSDAEFAQALAGAGYADAAAYRAELERRAVITPYLQNLPQRFTFGDAVVAGFYNLNRDEFARDAEACVRHILVPTEAEARTVVTQLGAGGDFAAIAREKSKDPGGAAQGGDLGCIAPGDTVEAFDKASFTGPLNQPQVVQTQFGWHVLTVSRRSEAGTMPLSEAAPLIRQQLAREAAQKYLDAQLARVKTETFPATVQPAGTEPAKP